jgi:hypothetical protein
MPTPPVKQIKYMIFWQAADAQARTSPSAFGRPSSDWRNGEGLQSDKSGHW